MENKKIKLPKAQALIIKKALNVYKEALKQFNGEHQPEHDELFDLESLIAFTNYDIEVSIPMLQANKFAHLHGVDIPVYVEEKAKVTEKEFIEWYFDSDNIERIGKRTAEILKYSDSEVSWSIKELFDECGYIPPYITNNDREEDYTPNVDVELIKG